MNIHFMISGSYILWYILLSNYITSYRMFMIIMLKNKNNINFFYVNYVDTQYKYK